MKLVSNSAGTKDGELPAAETCALSDDEEEQYDAVQFKDAKGSKFFSKFKLGGNNSMVGIPGTGLV